MVGFSKWIAAIPIGTRVPHTNIIPCKAPLSSANYKQLLESSVAFSDPNDAEQSDAQQLYTNWTLEELKKQLPECNFIIDFSDNNRFYAHHNAEESGMKLIKINTPGSRLPSPQLVEKVLKTFDELKDEKCIAVHCKHGINRTGYYICKYLMSKSMAPGEALAKFKESRGHSISKQFLIDDLMKAE